jgi:curli production assembly/transport component CsgE
MVSVAMINVCFLLNSQVVEIEDTAAIGVEDLNFLFDETITKVGSDFYRMFASEWNNPSTIKGISIFIGENPIPGLGTQIWVKVNERFIYRSVLRPNNEKMKEEVKKALLMTYSYFINYELIQRQLDSEDFSGNGLY